MNDFFNLFHCFNGAVFESKTEEILELTDNQRNGNTGCESRCDCVGDKLDKTAEFEHTHKDKKNTCNECCKNKS